MKGRKSGIDELKAKKFVTKLGVNSRAIKGGTADSAVDSVVDELKGVVVLC